MCVCVRACVRVCVCVYFLNVVILCVFLLWGLVYAGNSSTYFKVLCRSLQKKSDRTRCLAVSILEFNTNWNSKSAERAKAFWFSEERNSVVIHR